jgi:Ser/Thr protein kinase RdoA (MazF antagonist)
MVVMVSLDAAVRNVLACYPLAITNVISLGNRGGFSGARLWRIECSTGLLCLRAWATGVDESRLAFIHGLMTRAHAAGLAYVPGVRPTGEGRTCVEQAGRLWDLTSWRAGRADFRDCPSAVRLEAACLALARLHLAWREALEGPCPAVRRRLECARQWLELLASGWRPFFTEGQLDPVQSWAQRAWPLVQVRIHDLPKRLVPWTARRFRLQPCLCDVWHDHVLFEGNTLTGLIDYGSARVDHVAVDLARLLGSLTGDDGQLRAAGLGAYRRLRPLTAEEVDLVAVLDETGTLLAAVNWLKWLYHEQRPFEDRFAVAQRLAEIVRRVERW